MDLVQFTQALSRLSSDDIRSVAVGIDSHLQSAADEVAWWQATITIDKALKRAGQWREAALAASAAAKAVVATAERAGVVLPDPAVTSVARSAGEVARGLVAGECVRPVMGNLLAGWEPLLLTVAPAA